MESRIIRSDFEFCACEKEFRTYIILPGANGEPIREPAEDYHTPERCESCGKRNREPLETTFVIEPRLQAEI